MKISDILLIDFEPEISSTRRLLERIPEQHASWKPHDKSMPLGRLALHVARLPQFWTRIITTPGLDMGQEKFPDIIFESTPHLLSELERHSAEARDHLVQATDEQLGNHWKLSFRGRVVIDAPRMVLYRTMFMNHLVHHRAQLTVSLRLLDVAIPGLYGPSADEPFGA